MEIRQVSKEVLYGHFLNGLGQNTVNAMRVQERERFSAGEDQGRPYKRGGFWTECWRVDSIWVFGEVGVGYFW